jgi:hypothetical protein
MTRGNFGEFDPSSFPLDDFVSKLRPVGVGTPLMIPPTARDLFKYIAVFPDGSVGVMWKGEHVLSFATVNSAGVVVPVVPTADDIYVGCKVLYLKASVVP